MRTSTFAPLIFCFILIVSPWAHHSVASEKLKVLTTIRPLHSIAAAVMHGAGKPELLMSRGESPHGAAMRPSQMKMITDANLIIWFGPDLEASLVNAIKQAPASERALTVNGIPGLKLLAPREPTYEAGEEHHEHGTIDPHVWLEPTNAALIARHIAKVLGEMDRGQAEKYAANAEDFARKTERLSTDIKAELESVKAKPFLTLHDGLQYFENRFGLNGKGAIMLDPERSPGAKHIRALQKLVAKEGVRCLLLEPQYPTGFAKLLDKNQNMKTSEIDIIGANLPVGRDLYFSLMQNLKVQIKDCLAN